MKQVKSLTVVGGGTSGLIAALILKSRSDIDVKLIYSSKIEILGVGEGTTEHFGQFMSFVGIKHSEIIKECGATFKLAVVFEDWVPNKKTYIHSVNHGFSHELGQYCSVYAKQISENSDYIYRKNIEKNLVQINSTNIDNYSPVNQYHFDNFKLNKFLRKKAIDKNITIIDDDIIDVELNNEGYIDNLIGLKSRYSSDFYLDATGFKRILMNKLNAKWISYNKFLKVNSAIVFPTGDEENYNYFSLSKAMNSGWRFKIPTWGRHGNGYIFDNNFITADEAKIEIEKDLGYEVEIAKTFKFDAGALENVWIKNCVGIGVCGNFFEPLEATSIGLTIQQSFLLMHRMQNYDEIVIKEYNKSFTNMVENIRDFICLHYITKKNNTEFWKNNLKTDIPDSLKYNLEKWKNKLPIREDFVGNSNYTMFGPNNFITVMAGLDLFNKSAILDEYNFLSKNLKNITEYILFKITESENSENYLTHKQILKIIRNEE